MRSPGRMARCGFPWSPLTFTRPRWQAVCACERVLKRHATSSQMSRRTVSSATMAISVAIPGDTVKLTCCQEGQVLTERCHDGFNPHFSPAFVARPTMHRTQRCFLASGCSTYCQVRLRAPRVENPTGHGTSPPSPRKLVRNAGWLTEEDDARAAIALAAGVLDPGQPSLIAQVVECGQTGIGCGLGRSIIEDEPQHDPSLRGRLDDQGITGEVGEVSLRP
jgi:hypothetical protein